MSGVNNLRDGLPIYGVCDRPSHMNIIEWRSAVIEQEKWRLARWKEPYCELTLERRERRPRRKLDNVGLATFELKNSRICVRNIIERHAIQVWSATLPVVRISY